MKTIKVKVYEFKELSKEVQERVLNNFRNSDNAVELDLFTEDVEESIKENQWDDIEVSYSLSCSQGDGLSFKGYLNIEYFLNNVYSKKLTNYKKRAIKELIYDVFSKGNESNYAYCARTQINFNYNYDKEFKHLEKLWEDILVEICDHYTELCSKYEKQGYNEIDYQLSDEYIKEGMEADEDMFLINGEIFNQ